MKEIKLPILWRSSDAEYDDSIDFDGINLILSQGAIQIIQEAVGALSQIEQAVSMRLDIGDIQFYNEENEDDPNQWTHETEYRYDFFEIIVYDTGACYPIMQSKYNASNQIEFESFTI